MIALDDAGEPDFALLQARIKGKGLAAEPNPFVYEVFDLLHLDGRSLLDEPLEERRRLLAGVMRTDPRVRLSEHIEADGIAFFEAARTRGPRGDHGQGPPVAVRARASAPTAGRRSRSGPSRSSSSAAGRPAPARRSTSGRSSSGSTRTASCATRARSGRVHGRPRPSCSRRWRRWRPTRRRSTPPVPRAAARDARWLRPELVIRAEFAGWTGDGLVRQAAYKGIELEKDPRKVIRERPRS